jgi:hypothetical protein
MSEKTNSADMMQQRGMLLGVGGLILVIIGALIVFIPGMPFRGSGLGTICIVIGIVLLGLTFLRGNLKSTK